MADFERKVPLSDRRRSFKIEKIERYNENISFLKSLSIGSLITFLICVIIDLYGEKLDMTAQYRNLNGLESWIDTFTDVFQSFPFICTKYASFISLTLSTMAKSISKSKRKKLYGEISRDDELREKMSDDNEVEIEGYIEENPPEDFTEQPEEELSKNI